MIRLELLLNDTSMCRIPLLAAGALARRAVFRCSLWRWFSYVVSGKVDGYASLGCNLDATYRRGLHGLRNYFYMSPERAAKNKEKSSS